MNSLLPYLIKSVSHTIIITHHSGRPQKDKFNLPNSNMVFYTIIKGWEELKTPSWVRIYGS